MKAVVYSEYGAPNVLRIEDLPQPIPGENEVVVKISATSINSWDWDTLSGRPFEYRLGTGLLKPKNNLIHGCDIAGTVVSIGKRVTRFKVGDEVFGDLGATGWGVFSEYVATSDRFLSLKPSTMSFEDAACLAHAGNLASQGLIQFGKIRAGQKVLINGGGGCTGTLAIQIAKSFDVDLTCVDRAEKMVMMRELGADHVIDYTQQDVTKIDQRYDLIFDVKTNHSIGTYKRLLSEHGRYVTVGGKSSRILPIAIMGNLLHLYDMHMVVYKPNQDNDFLIEQYLNGHLKPVIDKRYPLSQIIDAFTYFGEGHFKGKIVILMNNA